MKALFRPLLRKQTFKERLVDLDFADDVALLADSWMLIAALVMNMEE